MGKDLLAEVVGLKIVHKVEETKLVVDDGQGLDLLGLEEKIMRLGGSHSRVLIQSLILEFAGEDRTRQQQGRRQCRERGSHGEFDLSRVKRLNVRVSLMFG